MSLLDFALKWELVDEGSAWKLTKEIRGCRIDTCDVGSAA